VRNAADRGHVQYRRGRPWEITFADMRDLGVRGLLIYCADYRCSHSIAVSADQWPMTFAYPILS
jgi:hypothetical protein